MDPWDWHALQPLGVEYAVAPQCAMPPRAWSAWCEHERHVLEWIDADGMRTRVRSLNDGRPFIRPARRWHLYGSGTAYSEWYDRPDRINGHGWMFFRMRVAPPNLAGRDFAAVEDPEDRLGFYLRTMYNVQQDGEPHAIPQLHGLLWSVMGELLTAAAGAGTGSPEHPWVVRAGPPPRMNTLLARFDAMVARHLADPPSVPELASRLALSASRLTHRLQAEGGTTAVSRIRWLRIREARRLLGMGLGVKEVASMLGFSSPAVFARVFRAIVGLTPQEYRRRLPPSGSAVVQTPC